jgi:HEAT repeat protein
MPVSALHFPLVPGKRKFEERLAALDALRQQEAGGRVEALRKALQQKNNFVVAKAADLVREFRLAQLTPELLTAFDRFFDDPVKTDPQCWAKNSISRALAEFEHQDAEVFLRGMRFIQHEPVWGGSSDTAGSLRAACALALVQCRSLNDGELLKHLVDLLGDKEKVVRVEAIRAIEQVGSSSSSLLLRLRAILGADEAEVLGACYSGILRLEGASAIPWISRFLDASDDSAAEAALAIAGTHSAQAFDILRRRLVKESDPWFSSVLLSAIALTRQEEALEFLLDQVKKETPQAEAAIEAILRSVAPPPVIQQLESLVEGNNRLARVLAAHRNRSR